MSKLGKVIFVAMGLVVLTSSARADEAKKPQPLSRKEMKQVRGSGGGTINYDALKHDQAGKGNSRPQPANPYTRGCSAITRCRG